MDRQDSRDLAASLTRSSRDVSFHLFARIGLLVIEATTTQLRKTALNSTHRRMGAKMVNFGGWDMPVEYSGIVGEHLATRTAAGLFDVSHMGEIEVRGPQALDWSSSSPATTPPSSPMARRNTPA